MGKTVVRIIANLVIIIGLFLLGKVLSNSASGATALQYFGASPQTWIQKMYTLGLDLPIPLHIISVGLVIQLRWLSLGWARIARWAVVTSGCWLGLALTIRWLAL